jgi:RHS repeat-associated protein
VPIAQFDLGDSITSELLTDTNSNFRGIVEVTSTASSPDTVVNYTDYDSYGSPITGSGGSSNPGGLTTGVGSDLDSMTQFGFGGGYVDATGLSYLVNRYYDPVTGQFISVDPDVGSTGTPFAYVDDNPANGVDPTGNDSEGYCGDLSLGEVGTSFGVQACMVETNGNQEVGITASVHGIAALSTGVIVKALNQEKLNYKSLFGGNLSLIYQTSTVNHIKGLRGYFDTWGASATIGDIALSWQGFFGRSGDNVAGNEFGVGWAFGPLSGLSWGPGFDYTFYWKRLSGRPASVVSGLITALNIANPLHWLAGPLNLYRNGYKAPAR